MEPPHNYLEHDSNDMAFIHATMMRGGRDAVEEFMSSRI
jgi:hypothetical protein